LRRGFAVSGCALAMIAAGGGVAHADFPWSPSGNPVPNDLGGDGNAWKFAATPEPDNSNPVFQAQNALVRSRKAELCGVRGAAVADPVTSPLAGSCEPPNVHTAWQVTTGRPDVAIAVLDSGIKWNDAGAMNDLRHKVRLNRGELPMPNAGRATPLDGSRACAQFDTSRYDANGDGVFNVDDYACDTRVNLSDSRRAGPGGVLVPQDLIIAFSDGSDADHNGFVDDIAGWDFLDNDNDPYDDVQYGHGTGEASDSSSEANNGGQAGSCPNCMVVPLRVGDSFVADANRFGQAALYAVDNGVLVIQEALGTLNNTHLAREAIDYAYHHGVAVIASAADEAAQHHNYVSSLPHTIVVNSADQYDQTFSPQPRSYLQFNGCTNFSSKVTIAVPSSSCSSNATGLGAGMAGLVYSAALDAVQAGRLSASTSCKRADGSRCPITANEVRQLMASGSVASRGAADGGPAQSDDVNFASGDAPSPLEPSCSPTPAPGCTDPNGALTALVAGNRPVVSPLADTRSYPARRGPDQFYGWGRVNARKAVQAVHDGAVPPQVEITSPEWFAQVDPSQSGFDVSGHIEARGGTYTCQVLIAPGSYPNNARAGDSPPGDFHPVGSPGRCDGGARSGAVDGALAHVSMAELKSYFPADAGSFNGTENGSGAGQTSNGRPNSEPYGFTVWVKATTTGANASTGEDRRNAYLHRDQDMLPGFPRQLAGDGESSPLFADLNGDNRNELVFATADGIVHAMRPDGSELPGWPVHGDQLPLHTGGRAFTSGEVPRSASGAFLASLAAADLDGDGHPEVVGADFEGRIYAWNGGGHLLWKREGDPNFSGRPLRPFENVRNGPRARTQHGFLGSPVIADLDSDGRPEVIAAGMDRHVYAFHGGDGSTVGGFPVLVVDRSKVQAIDPTTHALTWRSDSGADLNQGAIVDTPAVADLDGDGKAEIVVGTNEEYRVNDGSEGDINAGNFDPAIGVLGSLPAGANPLKLANGRLYAIKPGGEPGGPQISGSSPFLAHWPVAVGRINAELLPVVGEGITGSPVIGPAAMDCGSNGGAGRKVGVIPDAGIGYIFNRDGTTCQGRDSNGRDNGLKNEGTAPGQTDTVAFPALGEPAFGNFAGGVSFLAPQTGLLRALDVAAPEYQAGGQDFVGAWDPTSSQGNYRAGFPAHMNDLQFLTGPSVGDIDGNASDEEIVGGSASLDLQAYDGSGRRVSRWPKLTSDWTIADPLLGPWGARSHKVVVSLTRSGSMLAYDTPSDPCSPSSWPRFHHDNANSGSFDRDAVPPGTPTGLAVAGGALSFVSPGDDLMCRPVQRYDVRRSDAPITAANFAGAETIAAPAVKNPEQVVGVTLPTPGKRYLAVRAIDHGGNAGPVATIDLGKPKR
jgi:hypothetical protein